MPSQRPLRIWNGASQFCRNSFDPRWEGVGHSTLVRAYVCAYSRADARRVIEAYSGSSPSDADMSKYWSEAWGRAMEGIERERGLWLAFEVHGKPVRVDQHVPLVNLSACKCGSRPKDAIKSSSGVYLVECSNEDCLAMATSSSASGAAETWNRTASKIF